MRQSHISKAQYLCIESRCQMSLWMFNGLINEEWEHKSSDRLCVCFRSQDKFQSDPDSYNGAVRENYSWSQDYTDVEIRVFVPKAVIKGRQVSAVCSTTWHSRKTEGAFTRGSPCRAWACLTPRVQFVWTVWVLCTMPKRCTLCRPWHSWKRWTSARYGCTCTSTSTVRRHRCDCLWRIHLKFRQKAYKVQIKNSGKICNCF